MYPKVKVRVQKEEVDQLYDYEKTSLQSLKGFEWLSLQKFSSSDDSPGSVVRVPRAYNAPKTPPPSFLSSKAKEETNIQNTVVEGNQKNVRANSAPRPRAVLSSRENDEIISNRAQSRRQLFPGLKKSHDSCPNRHAQCKTFPKSTAAESCALTQGHKKESADPKNDIRANSRAKAQTDSRIRAGGHRKKTTPSSIQS